MVVVVFCDGDDGGVLGEDETGVGWETVVSAAGVVGTPEDWDSWIIVSRRESDEDVEGVSGDGVGVGDGFVGVVFSIEKCSMPPVYHNRAVSQRFQK